MQDHGISQAVLSPMGLAVLKSVPESIQIKETTGDRLAKLVKEGSFDGARDLVKSALLASLRLAAPDRNRRPGGSSRDTYAYQH